MLTCPNCGRESPEGFAFCPACATPLGATATAREVRKTVTALFCDLVGSTTLAETHDPEVLRPVLDRYFDEMRSVIERHGGLVQKFIGDAVVAVFGLPAAHEDDALRAVRAAVEMQAGMATLNEGSTLPLACRIGVTTGEVLVPGDGKPLIGDAMNTASRLQSSAKPGGVLIGESTFRLVRDAVVAEPVEPLSLKGKAEPVPAYRVLQVASLSPMRTRRLDAPMIGRERESDLLDRAFERAGQDRACQLFTVLGTAGAGKSRLVEEFIAKVDDATVIQGRCLPYGEGITYYPVTEALKGALGLADFDEESRVRDAIAEAVADEEHAEAITANLSKLLGAGEGGAAEETFWAIRRFFETRGREHPLVVVFDDIHWGEETFLDLIEHVADWSRDAQILLLCMARPDLLDVRPGWSGGKTNATTISLAPLSEDQCDRLIDELLGSSELPEQVRGQITRVAEGNPLFVEEMLRMLVDDGLLIQEGDRWVPARDLSDVKVPPTISALLSARLDRLSEPERSVLERAAVAGKQFHRGAVLELLPEADRAGADVHLRSLVRKELITPERSALPGQDAYRFRHLLIPDAAYDQIPKSERAELHVGFADWLETVAGERIIEQEEIVGYHLERAYRYREELGLPEDRDLRLRAARALKASGARAQARGDAFAAIRLLRSAADLSAGDPLRLPVLKSLSDALFEGMEFDEMKRVSEQLHAEAISAGDEVHEVKAEVAMYYVQMLRDSRTWDDQEARDLMERSLRVYRGSGDPASVISGLVNVMTAGFWTGRTTTAVTFGEEAFVAARAQGDSFHATWAISLVLGSLLFGMSPLSQAFERADAFVRSLADEPVLLAGSLSGRAVALAMLGRLDAAKADIAACRQIGTELAAPWIDAELRSTEVHICLLEESAVAAQPIVARRYAEVLASGDGANVGATGQDLVRVLLQMERDDEAAEVLDGFREHRVLLSRIPALRLGGVIAARRGDHDEALRLSDQAVQLAGGTEYLIEQGEAVLDRAEVLQLAGRPDEARRSAEDALERFERKEYALGARRARAFLDRMK